MSEREETLLTFPCEFPIKAMGRGIIGMEQTVIDIVNKHLDSQDASAAIKTNSSSNGKYISVTVTIVATSRAQLDNIYLELNAHPDIVMTL